ncbi:MAG: AEC family transporter [Turicibacter sp.]|nr:AEC family transporter [Turicibacter sp.]
MELAFIAFRQIFMMLMLMGIGVLCAKTGLIDEAANGKLSAVLLYIITPAIIFVSFLRPLEAELVTGLMMAFGLSLLSFVIKLGVTTLIYLKNTDDNRGIEKYACIYSNAGFIGIPLIFGVFGSEGVFYLTAYLFFANFLQWTHGIMAISGQMSFSFFTRALRSPAIIASVIGFIVFFLQVDMPDLIIDPIRMLSDANAPLAMIVAGFALSKADIRKILINPNIYKVAFIRLLLLPLLVIGLFSFFNVPMIIIGTVVILTACPVAINIVMFAYQYEKNDTFATELMIFTTILSIVTIPLLLLFI